MNNGTIAVVTGASQGIGREVARQLAMEGRDVVMVARNTPRLSAAAEYVGSISAQVIPLPADLSRMVEVHRLADELHHRWLALNVLVHRAAVILSKRQITNEGFEETFATNVMAPFLLSYLLADSLRRNAPARVIFFYGGGRAVFDIDDLMSEHGYDGWLAYNETNNADVMIALELAKLWRGTGVSVNCVFPGLVKTAILGGIPGYLRVLLPLARPFLRSPSEGATVATWAATGSELSRVSGKLFGSFVGNPRREFSLPRVTRNPDRRQQLFAQLCEITGIQPSMQTRKADAA
jgi:NAD(P)-dependent dehydrogenase (short-subunit alcohol dehydrogenase family)